MNISQNIDIIIKTASIALSLLLVIMLTLFVLNKIDNIQFFITAGVIAALAFWVFPKLRTKFE